MKQLHQTYVIYAPIDKVWAALTTQEAAEQWGAGPANVDPKVGGKFSYWGGDVQGTFTKFVPNELLEQDWYGHDNPTWKYRVKFTFKSNGDTTTVNLEFSGNIIDEHRDISDWKDYYFEPIKKLLEK